MSRVRHYTTLHPDTKARLIRIGERLNIPRFNDKIPIGRVIDAIALTMDDAARECVVTVSWDRTDEARDAVRELAEELWDAVATEEADEG